MRIIGGRLGGRRLATFKAEHIRPTSDRVKEALFNIMGQTMEGWRVLDLFSGTGNLALEAWSRGAKYVELVEKNPKSLEVIRKNLELFDVSKSIKVIKSDVFTYLKKYRGDPFDLIIIDPPFTESLADSVMKEISKSHVWQKGSSIAIESSGKETIEDRYYDLLCVDRRDLGDKMLSIFEPRIPNEESHLPR